MKQKLKIPIDVEWDAFAITTIFVDKRGHIRVSNLTIDAMTTYLLHGCLDEKAKTALDSLTSYRPDEITAEERSALEAFIGVTETVRDHAEAFLQQSDLAGLLKEEPMENRQNENDERFTAWMKYKRSDRRIIGEVIAARVHEDDHHRQRRLAEAIEYGRETPSDYGWDVKQVETFLVDAIMAKHKTGDVSK